MPYPVTYLALGAEDADALRGWHAAGEEATVLARVRELAATAAERLSIDHEREPIRRGMVGSCCGPSSPRPPTKAGRWFSPPANSVVT